MAQNQIYKQLSPYNFFRIEVITRTGTAFQRMRAVKGVKLKRPDIYPVSPFVYCSAIIILMPLTCNGKTILRYVLVLETGIVPSLH